MGKRAFRILFLTFTLSFQAFAEQSNDLNQQEKKWIASGVYHINHPLKPKVKFSIVNRFRMDDEMREFERYPGLYRSIDNGDTWKLHCSTFEFVRLYIHPKTGRFYAIIRDEWIEQGEGGILSRYISNMIITSEDGKKWKNITRGNGRFSEIYDIFQDPDNPNRVCVKTNNVRSYIWQSKDLEYTKWIVYKSWDWPERRAWYER